MGHHGLLVPIDLELGHAGLLSENVAGESADVRSCWWTLIHFLIVIFNIDVVSHAQKLLVVLVRARQKYCSNSNDLWLVQLLGLRRWRQK